MRASRAGQKKFFTDYALTQAAPRAKNRAIVPCLLQNAQMSKPESLHSTPSSSRRRAGEWLVWLALGAFFVLLTVWSWRKWTDVLVDFGLQFYTPWQLAQGKVLYRDISYIAGGPLSQYYHALLFKSFGASYLVIALSNLAITALATWGVCRWLLRATDKLTALAGGVLMLGVFCFGHLHYVGNYNFITPYTCETTHGMALAILSLLCSAKWMATNRARWAGAAGLALGAVFLTKPEIFVAAAGALGCAIVLQLQQPPRFRPGAWLALAGGMILPATLFAFYFTKVWPGTTGWRAAAGAWLPLLGGKAGHGQFYNWCLGLDEPWANLGEMAQYTIALVAIVAAMVMGVRLAQQKKYLVAGLLAVVLTSFLFSPFNHLEWLQAGRVLLPLTLAGCVWLAWQWRQTRDAARREQLCMPLLWSVFALLLLAKMGLLPRWWHYGFYLGLPAGVLGVYLLLWTLPGWLETKGINSVLLRPVMALFLVIGLATLLRVSNHYYAAKTLVMGGPEKIMAYPSAFLDSVKPDAARAEAVNLAVQWLTTNTPPDKTLAVLPEGPMINYLARRANPTPFLIAGPHELQVAGESNVLAAYAANPPDFILLAHRDTAEFGVGYFGQDARYAADLMRWIEGNYKPIWNIGAEPFQTNAFGLKMLERKAP